MIKKCLLTLILLAAVMTAQAEWLVVESAIQQHGETHYFDSQVIQKNGQLRKAWLLSSYDDRQIGGYHAVKSLYEIDCSNNKARSITMLLYPDKKAAGAVIGAHHEESQEWFNFTRNSIFHNVSEKICAN